jgi:hypothetical protein
MLIRPGTDLEFRTNGLFRKLRLIGTVVGCLILPIQTHAGSDVPRLTLAVSTSTTAAPILVASTSIVVSAASFTLILVASTFIQVTQPGGALVADVAGLRLCVCQRDADTAKGLTLDEARRIANNIAKLPKLLRKAN